MLSGMQVTVVDPADADALVRWYEALRVGAAHGRPAARVAGLDNLRVTLQERGPARERQAIAAEDAGETLGAALLELHLLDNPKLAQIQVHVPPGHRGRGVGSALLAECTARAAARGRSTYVGEVDIPDGHDLDTWPGSRFAQAHGFRSVHSEEHLLLDLAAAPAVDESSLDGYDLRSWVGPCPAELATEYAALHTAIEREVPTGTLEYAPETWTADRLRTEEGRLRRRGLTGVTTLVSSAGRAVGYSQILIPDADPTDAWQDDTFVRADHRGHGLGLAMKARNLRVLRDDFAYVRRVHTHTARANAPMQAINRAFGFVRVETMHEFQRVDDR
jgi:GNAT superfamily N-acetyltransferase